MISSARSPLVRGLLGIIAVALWSIATASVASAHAVVLSSTPSENEHLTNAPTEVTITFTETVSVELGGLKVLDSQGNRVDTGTTDQPAPATLHTALRPGLTDGTYLASYKIVSADGHPITGAVVFTFGSAGATDVNNLIEQSSPALDTASKVTQFLTYLGALLAVGLAFFLAFVHDGADDRHPLARTVAIAVVTAAIGVVLTIVVQAARVTDHSLTAAFDLAVLRPVLAQGLGWQSGGLLVGLALVYASVTVRREVLAQSLGFYGGIVATGSFVLWGHATESTNTWITIPTDIIHVAMGAAWFGGLVGLAVVLRRGSRFAPATTGGGAPPRLSSDASEPRGADEPLVGASDDRGTDPPGSFPSTVRIVRRFSTLAAFSVIALSLAGTAIAYTEVGSIEALTASGYGKLVLLKAGLVAVVVFTAGYNRYFLLPWLFKVDDHDTNEPAPAPDPLAVGLDDNDDNDGRRDGAVDVDAVRAGWKTLRNTVRIEALLIVAVLAVTAVLVNTTPGGTVETPPAAGPFQQSKPFRTGKVSITVTPNQPGSNSFHVDVAGPDGRPADLAQKMLLEVEHPAKDLGPLQRDMIKAGTGHFALENVPLLSIPGEWEITLIARVSDFDQERITFQDPIG